jgi:hypothetical protein
MDLKISRLSDLHSKVTFGVDKNFYLVEKANGYVGIKRDWWTEVPVDTLTIHLNDSIFPYDNRFLVYHIPWNNTFYILSGNAEWDDATGKLPFPKNVCTFGYIRGIQFGVSYVWWHNPNFTAQIREYRPEYLDYDYTRAPMSVFTYEWILIAAPHGQEDKLIEYIYYSDYPYKTGDKEGVYYEMRYVLPTNIESVTERHLVKRKLTEVEVERIINDVDGPLDFCVERYKDCAWRED